MSDQKTANLATHLRTSRVAWFWYCVMRALLVMESIVWTAMDAVRSLRMRVAAKINRNYARYENR